MDDKFILDKTFLPNKNDSLEQALGRVKYLAIGAHQDDIEIMAFHGILQGMHDHSFGGITCSDGAQSSRSGEYVNFTDEMMKQERVKEQNQAAIQGGYSFISQLGFSSADIKKLSDTTLEDGLILFFKKVNPEVIYTHNPFDKHPTHQAVVQKVLSACLKLPEHQRPKKIFGCEVWRGLDWIPDSCKVILDCSGHEEFHLNLLNIFKSQIAGGKRYDLATVGRMRANATFFESHSIDNATHVTYAIDLSTILNKNGPTFQRWRDDFLAFALSSI